MIKLTKREEELYEDWLYKFFDDEDEVVVNFYNDEYRNLFLRVLEAED